MEDHTTSMKEHSDLQAEACVADEIECLGTADTPFVTGELQEGVMVAAATVAYEAS